MLTYARGPAAGWSWLVQGCKVYGRTPGVLFGASVLMVVCTAILFGIELLVQRAGGPRASAMFAGMGVMLVLFGIVLPILTGGFMRVIRASREGGTPHAWMVLQPFRPAQGGARLALFALCMLVLYVAFFALVLGTAGRGLVHWYAALLTAQAAGSPVQAMAPLPAGSGVAIALLTAFLIFYSAAMAIGIGQVALGGRQPLAAFRDGIAGAFKNVLPLLVLTVCGLIAAFLVMLVFGILTAILVLLAHVLGGSTETATIVLVLVLEVLFALALYPIIVGIQFALWHDVTGGGQAGAASASATPGATA